jgi:hypothetical protein
MYQGWVWGGVLRPGAPQEALCRVRALCGAPGGRLGSNSEYSHHCSASASWKRPAGNPVLLGRGGGSSSSKGDLLYWCEELSVGVGAGVSVFLAVWQLRISAASFIWQGKGWGGGDLSTFRLVQRGVFARGC